MNGMHHRFDDDLRRWAIVGVCWFVSSSFALISTAASGAKRTIYARRGAAGCTGCHDDARRQNVVPHDVHDGYNNAIWFMVGSKYVATVFAVMALAKWWDRFGWPARALMTAVMVVVTSAATIQYLARSSSANLDEMTPLLREAAAFLDREARPGEVVVTRRNEAVLALTKLHIPIYITFSDYLSSRDTVLARAQDVEDFWRSWQSGAVRVDLLTRYGVDWIVATQNETPTALGSVLAVVFGNLEIKQEFMNGEFRIFRVRAIHGKAEP
jgi:hypothetical protein